jgi:hypothetical protein
MLLKNSARGRALCATPHAVAVITAIVAAAILPAELVVANSAIADPVYPVTEVERPLIIWGHSPESRGLIGYLMIGGHWRPRIYGVWRRVDGSIVMGQMPHNSVPMGFVRDEPESR